MKESVVKGNGGNRYENSLSNSTRDNHIITLTVKFAKMILKGVTKGKRGMKEVTLDCQICNKCNHIKSPSQE